MYLAKYLESLSDIFELITFIWLARTVSYKLFSSLIKLTKLWLDIDSPISTSHSWIVGSSVSFNIASINELAFSLIDEFLSVERDIDLFNLFISSLKISDNKWSLVLK